MEFKSCLLRVVQVVDVSNSMSHGGCDLLTVPGLGLPLLATLTGCLRGGVDLTSPSIKRNLNISKGVRY